MKNKHNNNKVDGKPRYPGPFIAPENVDENSMAYLLRNTPDTTYSSKLIKPWDARLNDILGSLLENGDPTQLQYDYATVHQQVKDVVTDWINWREQQ